MSMSTLQALISTPFAELRGRFERELVRDERGVVAFAGIERPQISDTICDPSAPEGLTPLVVDEPTISMTFEVNTSPFCGREGKYVTSRQIRERLMREVVASGDVPAPNSRVRPSTGTGRNCRRVAIVLGLALR